LPLILEVTDEMMWSDLIKDIKEIIGKLYPDELTP
jgi:hypothetical protein